MSKNIQVLRDYLERLGPGSEIADMYMALRAHGPQSISELSRNSGIERIQIYRLLDRIKNSGLIELEVRHKRNILHAAPITKVRLLLAKKDQELRDLQRDYAQIAEMFGIKFIQSATTRVQFYEGIDGIKQMLWNQTKGIGENLSILHKNMQNNTNLAFFERWAKKCNERGIHFRSVVSDDFISNQTQWYSRHNNERLREWQGRHIAGELFPAPCSLVVYDDTVLLYNWSSKRTFGIEIIDPIMAQMHRHFFEMLWRMATPLAAQTGDAKPHTKDPQAQ